MHITTPSLITSVAWEGALDAPVTSYSLPAAQRPVVTIGQPEIWPAATALENEVGKKWVPPMGDASYWLLRLACTLREPRGLSGITEAQQTLYLHPNNRNAGDGAAYAHSLFPNRLSVEDKTEFNIRLGPELTFASGAGFKVGELGVRIAYRKVFPVIKSYGAGESAPYWIFRRHSAHPLDGTQFVYAVVVEKAGAGGVWAYVGLTVTVETKFGPMRFGTPEEIKAHTRFTVKQS